VRDDTERDLILPAQAAIEYGVVDSMLTTRPD
jgi:ATP-dependent protease ClpP protease subunit